MNTPADCAIARHGDEVSSASISLLPEDEELIEAAVLVVCSPVTNAVRYGAQPPSPGRQCERVRPSLITLTLTLHHDALCAEVHDGSGILPVQRSAGRDDGCGRGLAIIDALAEYWTSGRAAEGGKWVRACMSGGIGLFDRGR